MSENVADSVSVFAGLSSRQRKVVEALLSGADKDSAAIAAGVTRRTVDRYLQEPAVHAALEAATGAALGDVARRMIGAMATALDTMLALTEDKDAPATVRLRAAIAIVEHGPRLFEAHELVKRIEALEARV